MHLVKTVPGDRGESETPGGEGAERRGGGAGGVQRVRAAVRGAGCCGGSAFCCAASAAAAARGAAGHQPGALCAGAAAACRGSGVGTSAEPCHARPTVARTSAACSGAHESDITGVPYLRARGPC